MVRQLLLRNAEVPSLQGRSFRVREPAAALLWSRRSKKRPENTKTLISDPVSARIRQEWHAVRVRNTPGFCTCGEKREILLSLMET